MFGLTKKIAACLLVLLFLFSAEACRSKGPYNPFLHMKTKPSEKQAKENKKAIKRGNKSYKKQLESNRKHLFGRKRAK